MNPFKTTLLVILSSLFLCFSSLSLAEDKQTEAEMHYSSEAPLSANISNASYGEKIGHKALWGLTNITLGFFEVPKNMIQITNRSNIIFGVTGGLALGMLNTGGRMIIGAVDLTFFLLPTKPVVQPIHPWQNYLTTTTEYNELFKLDL